MKKNDIITEIYLSKEIKNFKAKLPDAIRDDVVQHVFCEILEKEDEFIIDLHNRGKLKSYIVVCIYNAAKLSKHNSFGRQQSKELYLDILPDHFISQYETPDIDLLSWYENGIIELYAEHNSVRLVCNETHIPKTSIRRTILKARGKINNYNNYIDKTIFR